MHASLVQSNIFKALVLQIFLDISGPHRALICVWVLESLPCKELKVTKA